MNKLRFSVWETTSFYGRLRSGQAWLASGEESILLPTRMVISVSTGLGLLLVNSSAALTDFLPSLLTSVFPATPASAADVSYVSHTYAKREELSQTKKIVYGCLIPVLVILSGVFAGLTLGYMSLDETQLNVLSISGTP
jgi:hypothetical protein